MSETAVRSHVEFRVLGPVEAARDGRTLSLGGTRQRALLAVLLIDANQVVSTSRLIEEVFAAEHSATTVNRLQVGISRLRAALDGGAGSPEDSVLVSRPGGYALMVAPDQLDYLVFEQLSEEGRDALLRGDAETASTLLRRALSLWRGEAFCDLTLEEVAQREVLRLDGLRLATLMDRLDADLALGADAELVPELEALIARHPSQERLLGQLMLALYRSGRQADALAAYRRHSQVMRNELGLEVGPGVVNLERQILCHDPDLAAPPRSPNGVGGRVIVCPYKGLASFEAADAEYFCGREQIVANLIARVAEGRLVGIVGASGMGKSSLLRAGLMPALAAGALPGSETWEYVLVRPGSDPSRALAQALSGRATTRRTLLAIDQFEEVFTACHDADRRAAFMSELVDLALDPRIETTVVVALRADFYGRCAASPEFAQLLSSDHTLVVPMRPQDMLSAIETPALRVGLELEPGLSALVVDELGDEPGSLPLLSTALLELWAARAGSGLTIETYRSLGGVRGAVARLAERAYTQLDEPERAAARAIFLRLVTGDGQSAVRRRAPLAELDLSADPARQRALDVMAGLRLLTVSDDAVEVSHEALLHEWPRLEQWMDEDRSGRRLHLHLVDAAAEWDANGRDPGELYRGARLAAALDWSAAHPQELNTVERDFVEQSHEASRREIVSEQRRNRRLRTLLVGVAALLVLAVIAGTVAAIQRSDADHASAAADRSATSALAQSLGAEAVSQPQIGRALLLAVQGAKLADSPITRSDLLATILRAPDMLASYYPGPGLRPDAVAVSPDGKRLAISEFNGQRLLTYSTVTRKRILAPKIPAAAASLAYTPDGKTLAAVLAFGPAGTTGLYLYNAASGREERMLPMPAGMPPDSSSDAPAEHDRALVITGGGRYAWSVFSNSSHGWLVRWDLTTGRSRAVRFPNNAVDDSPVLTTGNGDEVSATTNKGVKQTIWDSRTLRQVAQFRLPFRHRAIALSPDGRTLAVGSNSGDVALMNIATGAVVHMPNGHTGAIGGGAFTPDGSKLATSGQDNKLDVWSVADHKLLTTDLGHSAGPQGVVIDPQGRTVYSAALDGSVIAYDLTGHRSFGTPFSVGARLVRVFNIPLFSVSGDGTRAAFSAHGGQIDLVDGKGWHRHRSFTAFADHRALGGSAISPDGKTVAVSAGINANDVGLPGGRIWDVARPAPREIAAPHGYPREPLPSFDTPAFSPDGRRIVWPEVYGTDQTAGLLGVFDAGSGRLVSRVVKQPSGTLSSVVSDHGHDVITVQFDGRVRVYSLPHLKLLRTSAVVARDGAWSFAVSPNGRFVALGDGNGLVHLLSAKTLQPVEPPLLTAAGPAISLSFNHDGTVLAESGTDAATNLIDVASWRVIGSPLLEPVSFETSAVTSMFAARDQLFTVSLSGAATVWPISLASLTAHACSVAHRNLTRAEWHEFLPGRGYQAVCAG